MVHLAPPSRCLADSPLPTKRWPAVRLTSDPRGVAGADERRDLPAPSDPAGRRLTSDLCSLFTSASAFLQMGGGISFSSLAGLVSGLTPQLQEVLAAIGSASTRLRTSCCKQEVLDGGGRTNRSVGIDRIDGAKTETDCFSFESLMN